MASSMPRRTVRVMRLWHAGLLAAVVAAVLNAGGYALARSLGVSFVVAPPGRDSAEVSAAGVVALSAAPLLIATAVYGLLRRLTRRAPRAFTWLAAMVFVLMLTPPLAAAQDAATASALILMHVVATTAILVSLALFERNTFPGP